MGLNWSGGESKAKAYALVSTTSEEVHGPKPNDASIGSPMVEVSTTSEEVHGPKTIFFNGPAGILIKCFNHLRRGAWA